MDMVRCDVHEMKNISTISNGPMYVVVILFHPQTLENSSQFLFYAVCHVVCQCMWGHTELENMMLLI